MSAFDAILGSVLKIGLTWMSRRRLPQTEGTLTLPAVEGPVEIIRDRWGVPHIYADSLNDLLFAQGFVHAQDRLWQMEINRRTAAGRLSELFGEVALDTDRLARTFGFRRLAEADLEAASGQLRSALESYAAGVNVSLDQTNGCLPVEFALLRHWPEPWTSADSLAWARVMIWNLSRAWVGEMVRARLAERVGPERAADWEICYPDRNPIALPQGIEFNRLAPDGSLAAAEGPFLSRGFGSNGWAVADSKMATGAPVLCNDMHLPLQLPCVWYAVHLSAGPDGDVFHASGVSLPGLPLVIVGHNAHISWGATLAYTDCEDLFVEKRHPEDPHRYQFRHDWLEADVIPEPIRVKGWDAPHIEQVFVTRHGPIISDVVGYPSERVAVQSMALRPCPAIEGWFRLNRARGWDDFVEAVRRIEAPQLSLVYADVRGNTGYWVTGKVPVRAQGDGRVPVPGWSGEYEWVGEVPFEEMPHALNPAQGYIVTCNNRVVPDDYAHDLGSAWMNGYRARRLEDVFGRREALSCDDFRRLQLDFRCIPGLELASHLKELSSPDPTVQAAIEMLRNWDGNLTTDSVAGTLYEVTLNRLLHNVLEPALGPDLLYQLLGEGFHALLYASSEFHGSATVALLRMLDDPDSVWVQEAGGKRMLLLLSLEEAVVWLKRRLGADVETWQWGRLHGVVFPHAMGVRPLLARVFSRGPYPIGGDTDTVCQTAYVWRDPYQVRSWAPSYRQIVDLGDLCSSVMIVPPGQSGQLGSPHYDDLIEPWLEGAYIPMLWTREQVEQEAGQRLRLEPVAGFAI